MGTSLQVVEHLSPGRDLDAYVANVSTIPILTADEEKVLAERLFLTTILRPRAN